MNFSRVEHYQSAYPDFAAGSKFFRSLFLGFFLLVFLIGVAGLSGCAHTRSDSRGDRDGERGSAPKSITDVLRGSGKRKSSMVTIQDGEVIVNGIKLKNSVFDIPVTVNSRVEHWIDYFCGRGRAYFTKYLERSEYFIPYIVPLLKQNGIPEDLVYLAMIESGFNNLARSRARAVGPWQFMTATGRRYGLMVNWWVDERRDIEKSTLSAVQYLKDLYSMFQSWELAAASYNAGEAKVARAVRRFGSKDFWVISKHRFLRPETREYVPKMIAAAIISKNRSQFGFQESPLKPGVDEAIAGDGEIVKVIKTEKPTADTQYEQEKDEDSLGSNPEMAAAPDSSDDRGNEPTPTPEGVTGVSPAVSGIDPQPQRVTVAEIAKPVPTPHITKTGEVGGESLVDFDVQSPADLLKVARAAGLSYQTVKSLNPEILRWCTPPNVGSYRIRLPLSVRDRFLSTYNHEAFPRRVQFMTYKVRSGETLVRIARHFGIKVDPISDLNGISPRAPLRHGAKVLLPMPSDRSRTFASLEVRDPPERRRVRHHNRKRRGSRSASERRHQARSSTSSQANSEG